MSPCGGCLWPSAPENWLPEPRSTVWCCPLTIESRGVPWPGVSGAGLRATWLGWSTWKWISMMRWILWWSHCPSWNRKAVEGKVGWWWVATGGEVSECWVVDSYCWSSVDWDSSSWISASSPKRKALRRRRHNWVSGVLGATVAVANFVSDMQGVMIDEVRVLLRIR